MRYKSEFEGGKMEIREYREYNEDEIRRLYTEVGWTAYTENMAALEQGYKNCLESSELLAMVLPLFLFRIFLFFRKNSVRVSELLC